MTTYPKMNPHAKRKWVRALRSGRYPQAYGQLQVRDEDYGKPGFCCLGVLVAECRPESLDHLSQKGDIPDDLATLWDFGNPRASNDDLQSKLACMNDGRVSFRRIATWIEKHL